MRRERHRDVLRVLGAIDDEQLRVHHCLFGGGTRLALDLDEFRVSADIDFIVSDVAGYAGLRQTVRRHGPAGLFRTDHDLSFPREASTDQYGIRFPARLPGGSVFKVEVVLEGRIVLGEGTRPAWSPVDCLSDADAVAEKLLANSDRWLDAAFLSRDLLDLAAFRSARGPLPPESWAKARGAYGTSTTNDLMRAAERFLDAEKEPYRRRCFEGLAVLDPARLVRGVRQLLDDPS